MRRSVETPAGAEPADEPGGEPSYNQLVQGVGAIVAPVTLLTAIAFYFGWSRIVAFDEYFGLNPGMVGYSTRDYVLNSLDPLFLPVLVVLAILIGLAFAHALVRGAHAKGRRSDELGKLADADIVVGGLLLVVGALAVFGGFPFHLPYLIGTLCPAAGVILLAHGIGLRRRLRGEPPLSTGAHVLVGLFVALCLFWAAGLYAGTVGREEAANLAGHLDRLPGVALYSTSDLSLPAANGIVETLGAGTGYRYQYTGLRLFTTENGTLFLIPSGWKDDEASSLLVVPETPATRVALTPGSSAPTGALAAPGGNAMPPLLPPVATSPAPFVQHIGPLAISQDRTGRVVSVSFDNGSTRAVAGAGLSGTMSRSARPLVGGGGAVCRAAGSRFACRLDPIPGGGSVTVRVGYTGERAPIVRLTPQLGRGRVPIPSFRL